MEKLVKELVAYIKELIRIHLNSEKLVGFLIILWLIFGLIHAIEMLYAIIVYIIKLF